AFASAALVAELVENYWMALTRDVSFTDYETDPLINAAASDLSQLPDFHGPRLASQASLDGERSRFAAETRPRQVSPATLFRGLTPGDLTGPYVSQFLWLDAPFGAETISRRIRTVLPGDDYLTNFGDWLTAQVNTGQRPLPNRYDPVRRYIRNSRDLAEWVHLDLIFQPFLNAALILLGLRAPVDENNPYLNSASQIGFATFGPPHLLSLLTTVAGCALRGVWFQKWYVHRRLRPEEFGARVHNHLTGAARYPIHSSIFNSAAPTEVYRRFGSYLLPMAYPEGSPTHPAYGSGHAVIGGACATVLKAWFKEDWVLPNPVVAARDGLSLLSWRGEPLTVGGELNKLASNNGIGRNIGGVHWRSDAIDSLRLGEAIAIAFLNDMAGCFNETFAGFSLTKFDGTTIRLGVAN
ncbi:MAG: vanadium-dependent haloperoxidase, partial [Acidobacteriota bacterium]